MIPYASPLSLKIQKILDLIQKSDIANLALSGSHCQWSPFVPRCVWKGPRSQDRQTTPVHNQEWR